MVAFSPEICAAALVAAEAAVEPRRQGESALPQVPHWRRPDTVAAEAVAHVCGYAFQGAAMAHFGLHPAAIDRALSGHRQAFRQSVRLVVAHIEPNTARRRSL